jgi:hypothetical protein
LLEGPSAGARVVKAPSPDAFDGQNIKESED